MFSILMKRSLWAGAVLLAAAASAAAQETYLSVPVALKSDAGPDFRFQPNLLTSFDVDEGNFTTGQEPLLMMPMSIFSDFVPGVPGPTFGLRAGFLKARDADKGTWFGGVQLRFPIALSFAIEGSIEFHKDDYLDGDLAVVQYPVQVTALFFLMPGAPINPYLLAGLGWYYTRLQFSGALAGFGDETDSMFGAHLGFGVDFGRLSADLRYIFLNPDSSAAPDEKFDTLQFTLALNFPL